MRKLPVFKLEEYLEEREFNSPFMFSASDAESMTLEDLLNSGLEKRRQEFFQLPLSYTLPKGHPELVSAINTLYENKNVDNIAFCGAEEGIYCAFKTLLEKDDHAVVVIPCYQSLYEIPNSLCETDTVLLKKKDHGWDLDAQDIIEKCNERTKLIVINFPHNPTGFIPHKNFLVNLVDFARKNNIAIFSDEVYRFLEHEEESRLPAVCDIYENGYSLGVMSKSFGLAGLRVGWVASQNSKMLEKMTAIKHYLSICNSAPSEILSLIAIENKEKIFKKNRDLIHKNLLPIKSFIDSHPLFTWMEAKGGVTAFVEYHGNEGSYEFAENLRKEKGVVILPHSNYLLDNVEENISGEFFRIGYGRKNALEALAQFKEFLNLYQSRG